MANERRVLPEAQRWFIAQQRWPNEVMYHYTSQSAAENIIATRRMRATDLHMMNDPEELRYSKELIEDRLDLAMKELGRTPEALWLRTVHNGFQRIFITLCSSFSISFCEEPDTSSQWRDYGFEGTGVVLGWSIDSEYPEKPLQMWVTYERAKQEAIVDGLIQLHLRHVRAAVVAGNDIAEETSVAGLSLGIFLGIVLHNFKQPKWVSEKEF